MTHDTLKEKVWCLKYCVVSNGFWSVILRSMIAVRLLEIPYQCSVSVAQSKRYVYVKLLN